jgi:thermitase
MGRAFGVLLGIQLILTGASGGIPTATATSQSADEVVDQDTPAQKVIDVGRAHANGDVSPDRLVVVYDPTVDVNAPERTRVRQSVAGMLLHASRALRRDVLRAPNGDAAVVAQRVRSLPGVRDAYPDRAAHATWTVNDPMLSSEWGLGVIQAPTAWDSAQGAGVTVAVLDCGVHTSHPDLAGKVVLEHNFTATASTDDLCNHGTHVSGTIAAVTNNGTGIAGVAPGARILSGKVLNDTGSGFFSDIDLAMQWAADNGAQVINMSLEADIPCPSGTQTAADYAWSHGAVLVAAAGNSGLSTGAGAPANCLNVIGVAATDSSDIRALWSNAGPQTALAAPGVSVWSTVNPDLNGGYQYEPFSGTSMASPHVAGAAALVWSSAYGTSPSAVRDRLLTSADAIAGTGLLWSAGRLNAARAVAGGALTNATPTLTPTPTLTATPTATATPDPNPTRTLTFDDLTNPNRVLNGQYPNGIVDWGTNRWYLSAPYGAFRTNSVGFNGAGPTTEPLTVLAPWRLAQIDAYNGGNASSTVSLACAGVATVSVVVNSGRTTTIATGWTSPCSPISVGSTNGWDTNIDNVVVSSGGSALTPSPSPTSTPTPSVTPTTTATSTSTPTPSATATPTATARSTSTPTPSATATATATSTSTPTSTPVPGGQQSVTFNDLSNPNRVLSGQYPTNLIDWGSSRWYLSGPWGMFTTNSIGFNGPTPRSAVLTFVGAHQLVQLAAYNGGTVSSTVVLACAGQPNVTATLAPGQLTTLLTGWSGTCTSVTVSSTNGWDTNFDTLVVR